MTDDVYLNNARGFDGTGALVSSGDRLSIEGDVYLGDQGATVGLVTGGISTPQMTFDGNIHGGPLEVAGNGIAIVHSDGSTYTGVTRVGVNGDGTVLTLQNGGRLLSTSGFELGPGAKLRLDNQAQVIADRISDTANFLLRGSTIGATGRTPSAPVSEQLGTLTLDQGASTLTVHNAFPSVGLTMNRLERHEHSSIDFNGAPTSSGIAAPLIKFAEAPVMTDGILGGWATTSGSDLAVDVDFATYDSTDGVIALGNRTARPSQINGAGPTAHVRVGATPLQALLSDQTIGTLMMINGGQNVDLGGHALNVRDGGIIVSGTSSIDCDISNGSLTAGNGAESAKLYLHPQWTLFGNGAPGMKIDAAIIDNPSGQPVSLVKSGNSPATLSGVNSYSGATVAQKGSLVFANAASLPEGGELDVEGGLVSLTFQSTSAKHLSRLVLASGFVGATKNATNFRTDTKLNADDYQLESGSLDVSLSGHGTLRKTGSGVVTLPYESPDFDGPVIVEEGTLVAGDYSVTSPQLALGTGETTILPGATLIHAAVLPVVAYMELDAKLNLAGGDVGLGVAIRTTRWDFNGPWRVTVDSRLLLFDPLAQQDITTGSGALATPTVNLVKPVTLNESTQLSILGDGVANFAGSIIVSNSAAIVANDCTVNLSSVSPAQNVATLHLRGTGNYQFPNPFSGDPSKQMTVEVATGSKATPAAGRQFTVGAGITLDVNGQLANATPIALSGGKVRGNGLAGDLVNISGNVAPGNSVGVLTVGTYEQRAGGTLSMDLLGGPTNAADQLRTKSAKLSGLLQALLAPGSQVTAGEVFDLVVGSQVTTDGLALQTVGFSGRLGVATLLSGPDAGMQSLQLTVVPEPSSALLIAIAMLLAAARSQKSATALVRRQY